MQMRKLAYVFTFSAGTEKEEEEKYLGTKKISSKLFRTPPNFVLFFSLYNMASKMRPWKKFSSNRSRKTKKAKREKKKKKSEI